MITHLTPEVIDTVGMKGGMPQKHYAVTLHRFPLPSQPTTTQSSSLSVWRYAGMHVHEVIHAVRSEGLRR